jgi:hypothetical protein
MKSVADNNGGIIDGKLPKKCNEEMVAPSVLLDANGVKVRSGKINQELVQVTDVLHDPFNLFP